MEYFTFNNFLLLGSVMILVCVAVSRLTSRYGAPALLLFLLVGIFFGRDGLGLQFDDIETTQFIGRLTLSLILFSGGMETRMYEIKSVLLPGFMLSTLGVLLTTFFVGNFIWWLSGLSWVGLDLSLASSLLLAAAMSSTDSTAAFTVLRQKDMTLKPPIRPLLELESGSNDPMAYLLTITLMTVASTSYSEIDYVDLIVNFFRQFLLGFAIGWGIGSVAAFILKAKDAVNRDLYSVMFIGIIYFAFSFSEFCGGNGYLAVYITGVILGNSDIIRLANIKKFVGALSWLSQIAVFLCLGLLVELGDMMEVALVSLFVAGFMMLIGRPLSIFISLAPFTKTLDLKSRWFISWVGFRGAAAVIFAAGPVIADIEKSSTIFNIVFFITMLSLLVKGLTVKKYAEFLGLTIDDDDDTDEKAYSELSESLGHPIYKKTLASSDLSASGLLSELNMSKEMLVIMVRRGKKYLVPDGALRLYTGDILLMVKKQSKDGEAEEVLPSGGGGGATFWEDGY